MQISILVLMGGFAIVAGCASHDDMKFSTGTGDIGTFILKKATDFGGHTTSTNSVAMIGTTWRYSEDQYGVVIRTDPKAFSSVESLLHQSFGSPGFVSNETKDGFKLIQYRLTANGGGIQFSCDSNYAQIIVLKPHSSEKPKDTN